MSDILTRRQTRFVVWCPATVTSPPELIIGQLQYGNPPQFKLHSRKALQRAAGDVGLLGGLFELDASVLGLTDGQSYHYWFEIQDTSPGGTGRVQTTDPLAVVVDYRLYAPDNPSLIHPASVIGFSGGQLVVRDPNGEAPERKVANFEALAPNNRLVIYELPTAWARARGGDEFERAVGTFRDARALIESGFEGANFSELTVMRLDPPYLAQLGVNAVELLPPADSIYAREWGYGTSHYLAADYELGYPEGNLSPTANQDLTGFINACHDRGIRIFLDVVLGFMKGRAVQAHRLRRLLHGEPGETPQRSRCIQFSQGWRPGAPQPVRGFVPSLCEGKDHLRSDLRQSREHFTGTTAHADVPDAMDAGLPDRWHPHGQCGEHRELGLHPRFQGFRPRAVQAAVPCRG
jgi:hypothetical protein